MSVVGMELSPTGQVEASEGQRGPASPDERPAYPEGLKLFLDREVLSKLGLSELPKPGERFVITGIAVVQAVRADTAAGGQQKSLELQITGLGLETEAQAAKKLDRDRAKILYPNAD